jgi:hypothetical protein
MVNCETDATSPINPELAQLVKGLIFQQFYYGGNTIWGRAKDISVEIPGIDRILLQYQQRTLALLRFIEAQQYAQFLQQFATQLYPIDYESIYRKFHDNVTMMGEALTPALAVNFLLGDVLVEVQKLQFEKAVGQIQVILNMHYDIAGEKMHSAQESLTNLYGRNHKAISLLYSLMYLLFIAELEGDQTIINEVLRLMNRACEDIVKDILGSELK